VRLRDLHVREPLGAETFVGETISARIDEEIGWVLLGGDRPFSLDESVPRDLPLAVDAIENGGARALVLSGTTRVFCAGANLRLAPKLLGPAFARRWLDGHHEAIARLVELSLPTVVVLGRLLRLGVGPPDGALVFWRGRTSCRHRYPRAP
jgi:enoyl-CoA hydratase/carnithine racemase